jgi:alpha-tubulin suppressor-like RCC1 family protein
MKFKILFSLIFLIIITSCSKKEEEKVIEKTGLAVTAIGAVNFGGVLVGRHKDAAIKLENFGPDTETFNFDELTAPFSVVSKSVNCASGQLLKDKSCIISVRFQPTLEGTITQNLSKINSKINLNITGVGLVNGYLVLDSSDWNLGSISAGVLRIKEFTVTNLGDQTVKTPSFNLPTYITVGFNRCGSFIPAKVSCKISLEARLTNARSYDELYSGTSDDGGFVQFNITASVSPANPAGLITFSSVPTSLSSAGQEAVIVSNPIKDSYGNIVISGTNINVTTNNILLLLDGNNYLTNSSGIISFRVRTRTIKGAASISSVAGQASGYSTFPVTAGNAFGPLIVSDVLNEIPANGLSQVVINTNTILDQYLNIVEDGTEVFFEIIGDGVVNLGGANPKKILTYAINGTARAVVRAGTTAQVATLKFYSGPIFDALGNIVGYSANGEIPLNFVPGPAAGIIPVNSGLAAIYSNTNPPTDLEYLPTKTVVTIGPVKDQFNNTVKQNTLVNVIIDNGFNASGVIPQSVSSLYTNASGYVAFDLIGKSVRGNITVLATSALAQGQTNVWAYLRTKTKYSNNNSKLDVFFRHTAYNSIPLATANWAPIEKPEGLLNLDEFLYGYKKENAEPQTVFALDQGLPYYTWDCMFPAKKNIVFSFCQSPILNGEYAPLAIYDENHNISFDIPANNPSPEMVENPDFDGVAKEQFWNYYICTTSNCSSGTLGSSWSADLGGSLLVDNSVDVDNCTESNQELCPKKNNAFSNWISVLDSKKYIITFTVKNQFGQTIDRAAEVGIVEGSGTLSLLNANTYVLEPKVLKTDIINPGGSLVPNNVRVIFSPTSGTSYVRIYLSTKGTGDGSRIFFDDVSMKEIETQNIHDPLVSEGVSVGYMPSYDSAVIYGGGSIIRTGTNPYFYSSYTSDRTTYLTKILDESASVDVVNFTEDNPDTVNLGQVPSARLHSNIVGFNDVSFLFGGYENQMAGKGKNDLFKFDGATRRWSSLNIQGDPLLLNNPTQGKPIPRYQSGMTYVPELNRMFMAGGVYQSNEEDETVWTTVDDIWSFNPEESVLVWKRECNNCGLFANNIFTNIGFFQFLLETTFSSQAYTDYINSSRNIKRTNLIWHQPTQKMYVHIPSSNAIVVYDPYTKSVTVPPLLGINQMNSAFQIVYNPILGRTFSYVRGSPSLENSKIYYWDMNISEKQAIKARFKLDPSAKDNLQELKFYIHAYGSSTSVRNYGENITPGLEFYLYNYSLNSWYKMGETLSSTTNTMTQFYKKMDGFDIKSYVSTEGFVEVAFFPKGNPGIDGGEPLMGDDLEFIDLDVDELNEPLKVSKVVTALESTCALMENGDLKCWGRNNFGQLGLAVALPVVGATPNTMGDYLVTTKLFNAQNSINAGLEVTELYAGGDHFCALFNNNRAKCWGRNNYGQAGRNPTVPSSANLYIGDNFGEMGDNLVYIDVGTENGTAGTGPAKILKMSLGQDYTCALIESREVISSQTVFYPRVKCWGRNNLGQIGRSGQATTFVLLAGNSTPYLSMNASFFDLVNGINRDRDVLNITSGNNHTCAILTDSYVRCWGDNTYGQLGINKIDEATTKKEVPSVTDIGSTFFDIRLFVAGGNHTCSYFRPNINEALSLKCWGRNHIGQLGIGSTNSIGDAENEIKTAGIGMTSTNLGIGLTPINVTLGQNHSCSQLNNNLVKCWGENINAQIGQGPLIDSIGTTLISMGDNLPYVDLGDNLNGTGRTIKQMSTSSTGFYNCAILSNDQLKCWGINSFGQLGTEDSRNRGRGYDVGTGFNEIKIDYMELEEVY